MSIYIVGLLVLLLIAIGLCIKLWQDFGKVTAVNMKLNLQISELNRRLERLTGTDDSEHWETLVRANQTTRTWCYMIFDNEAGHRFSVVYLVGTSVPNYLPRLREAAKPKKTNGPQRIILRHVRVIFPNDHDTNLEASFIAGMALSSWAMGIAPKASQILPVIDDVDYQDLLDPSVRLNFRDRLASTGTLFNYDGALSAKKVEPRQMKNVLPPSGRKPQGDS